MAFVPAAFIDTKIKGQIIKPDVNDHCHGEIDSGERQHYAVFARPGRIAHPYSTDSVVYTTLLKFGQDLTATLLSVLLFQISLIKLCYVTYALLI